MIWISISGKKIRTSYFVLPLLHFDEISSSCDGCSWSGVLTSPYRDDMLCLATTDKEMECLRGGRGFKSGRHWPGLIGCKSWWGGEVRSSCSRGCVWIISLFHTGKHWSAVKAKAKETRRQWHKEWGCSSPVSLFRTTKLFSWVCFASTFGAISCPLTIQLLI